MPLVLTRKIEESVNIGNDIEVKVVGISGRQVKLAINAPKEIPVHRNEVYERIKKEKNSG